jgi:L-lactate dehydrogenase complex protein LldF
MSDPQPAARPFAARISAALDNPNLRIALDNNARRRLVGRDAAFRVLPDSEAVRDRGRAIRIDTLANLDTYLQQFEARVIEIGGQVHWAADAAEACAIVQRLVRQASRDGGKGAVPLVAKGKSMVSEEIGLNHALEHDGIEVVETDLGEFIVQLRGERPSHLIGPAVHLRREDVSELFQAKFGMPPTLDIEEMTAVARLELRRVFFNADVGISGVNFGVVETGTLALVTNEGNGRLVTGVPRVHIALMGIERLVPTLADLEVMLRLLPRSATSQKLTSYVSMINGPRRPGEPDGPEALHVVLVDNGRSRTLGGELAESLLCIRCGACLNICPVYREIGGHAYGSTYSGPIGAVVSTALFGSEFGELAHASTLCGACRDVCPVRIDIPTMLLAARAEYTAAGHSPAWMRAGMRVWAWVMARPGRYRAAQRLAAITTHLMARGGRIRRLPPPLDAWTQRRDFPVFAGQSFRQRWRKRQPR